MLWCGRMPKKPTRTSINLLDKISGFRCQSRQKRHNNVRLDAAMAGVQPHPHLHGDHEAHNSAGPPCHPPLHTKGLIDVLLDHASLYNRVFGCEDHLAWDAKNSVCLVFGSGMMRDGSILDRNIWSDLGHLCRCSRRRRSSLAWCLVHRWCVRSHIWCVSLLVIWWICSESLTLFDVMNQYV